MFFTISRKKPWVNNFVNVICLISTRIKQKISFIETYLFLNLNFSVGKNIINVNNLHFIAELYTMTKTHIYSRQYLHICIVI